MSIETRPNSSEPELSPRVHFQRFIAGVRLLEEGNLTPTEEAKIKPGVTDHAAYVLIAGGSSDFAAGRIKKGLKKLPDHLSLEAKRILALVLDNIVQQTFKLETDLDPIEVKLWGEKTRQKLHLPQVKRPPLQKEFVLAA